MWVAADESLEVDPTRLLETLDATAAAARLRVAAVADGFTQGLATLLHVGGLLYFDYRFATVTVALLGSELAMPARSPWPRLECSVWPTSCASWVKGCARRRSRQLPEGTALASPRGRASSPCTLVTRFRPELAGVGYGVPVAVSSREALATSVG